MTNYLNDRILRPVVAILALADGVLHFALDFVLFRGNFFGSPIPQRTPPAGAAPGGATPPPRPNPLILPLNELFLLNFVGALVLVLLFWFSLRLLGTRRWLMNVALIVYAAAAVVAWFIVGRPNPMGLGYLSKIVEILVMILSSVDIWSLVRPRGVVDQAA